MYCSNIIYLTYCPLQHVNCSGVLIKANYDSQYHHCTQHVPPSLSKQCSQLTCRRKLTGARKIRLGKTRAQLITAGEAMCVRRQKDAVCVGIDTAYIDVLIHCFKS